MTKDELTKQVSKLMLGNRRECNGFQYTVPSPQTYPYQWFWDSCFHAIILSHCRIEDAKKELLSLVSHQFENGMIPHMTYWDKASPTDFPVVEWGKEDTSTITQPPMLGIAAWEIYQKDQDLHFLESIYENLLKFCHYLMEDRKQGNGLLGIINPDESGEDNSPRFDEPLGLSPQASLKDSFSKRLELVGRNRMCNFVTKDCTSNFFFVKDVPFNVIAVENFYKSAEIAGVLGKHKDKEWFLNAAEELIKAMRELMLEDGVFWSVYGESHKKIKVETWAIFAPLFAKIYSVEQAKHVVDKYLLNEGKFKLNFIVPTVPKDSLSYDPKAPIVEKAHLQQPTEISWRGPVWMGINWFIYKGLINYGFKEEAEMIFKSSLNLIKQSGFREYYNPETGEGMGAEQFSWGGLVLDMYT